MLTTTQNRKINPGARRSLLMLGRNPVCCRRVPCWRRHAQPPPQCKQQKPKIATAASWGWSIGRELEQQVGSWGGLYILVVWSSITSLFPIWPDLGVLALSRFHMGRSQYGLGEQTPAIVPRCPVAADSVFLPGAIIICSGPSGALKLGYRCTARPMRTPKKRPASKRSEKKTLARGATFFLES